MNRWAVLVASVAFLLAPAGCNNADRGGRVIVEGGGQFPQSLVGTWKANKSSWELVFDADGGFSSVVIPLGQVRLQPNEKVEVRGRKGEPGLFQAGDFEGHYDPRTREISAIIEVKRIFAEIAGGVLDGSCEYFIAGNVAKNNKTIDAYIHTKLDLPAMLPDPNSG
ncbi:MAG: hypothetical protein ACYSR4_03055, partial [Planctomycetota bacterium]